MGSVVKLQRRNVYNTEEKKGAKNKSSESSNKIKFNIYLQWKNSRFECLFLFNACALLSFERELSEFHNELFRLGGGFESE